MMVNSTGSYIHSGKTMSFHHHHEKNYAVWNVMTGQSVCPMAKLASGNVGDFFKKRNLTHMSCQSSFSGRYDIQ